MRFCSIICVRNIYTSRWFFCTKLLHIDASFCFLLTGFPHSEYACDSRHLRIRHVAKSSFSSRTNSTNSDDHFTATAGERLKAVMAKKEAKRMERLARQRVNELQRIVRICFVFWWILLHSAMLNVRSMVHGWCWSRCIENWRDSQNAAPLARTAPKYVLGF